MKKWSTVLLITLLFVWGSSRAGASDEIQQDLTITYELGQDSVTSAKYEVKLTNLTTEKYANGFVLKLQRINPENIRAYEGDKELKYFAHKSEDTTEIEVLLSDKVVGKGNAREIVIFFQDRNLVKRTGEVREIFMPKLEGADEFDGLKLELIVPKSYGEAAYMTPKPEIETENENTVNYYFGRKQIKSSGITAAFGSFQIFGMRLVYHLNNPANEKVNFDIAIPPDTAYQRIIYEKIEPKPESVRKDGDGNWLASYEIEARSRLDVTVEGGAQIFSGPIMPYIAEDDKTKYIKESHYWQKNNESISAIAQELGSAERIYEFVVRTLSYDYDRVKPNTERMGAYGALASPENAICTEFTDLFIALARAAGIPAREVNGYAYTDNSVLKPLSLVADILHAWPEYWDEGRKEWIQIDPTWGKTTGGVDYFNKFDLRHITFVKHGENVDKPIPPGSYKLGENPQKDVFINVGKMPEVKEENLKITIKKADKYVLGKTRFVIGVRNEGQRAVYEKRLEVFADELKIKEFEIAEVLPYSEVEESIEIESGLIGSRLPKKISAVIGEEKGEIVTSKGIVTMAGLIVILGLITIATAYIYIRTKRR